MKRLPVALQLYSLREELKADLDGTLGKVSEMGYDGVELAGLYDRSYTQMRELMQRHGLCPISAHVPLATMREDPDGVFSGYAEIGCRYVALPWLHGEYHPGREKFEEFRETIVRLAGVARKNGITLLFHNHGDEFQLLNGERKLDTLYRLIPADCLQTEIDTCWADFVGVDAAAYVRQYSGRAPLVHLKNHLPQEDAGRDYPLFCPVGDGAPDLRTVVQAAIDAGTQWLVVEQDSVQPGTTPLWCAARSWENLQKLQNEG